MNNKIEVFLQKYETLLLLLIFSGVMVVNSRGLSWGLPGLWNPDELAKTVSLALDGLTKFDLSDLNYPSLPKYFMLFFGRITEGLGYPRTTFFLVARFISVFFSGMLTWIAYGLVRKAGGTYLGAFFAALLVAANSEIALQAHFAHNDLYVTFFVCLAVYFLVSYNHTRKKTWLYLSFFTCGMAASSKYPGGVIIIVIFVAYLLIERANIFNKFVSTFETIFVGAGLCYLGYGLGTPQAITWLSYYVKRLLPALSNHATYAKLPDSKTGLFIQWGVLRSSLGNITYWFYMLSFVAMLALIILVLRRRINYDHRKISNMMIVFGSMLALDLPILISYNVQPRFFLPMYPLFAVIGALLITDLSEIVRLPKYVKTVPFVYLLMILLVATSLMRQMSVIMTIKNDSRIEAGKFIDTLPAGSSFEITWYTPNIDEEKYKVSQYPLYFLKHEGEELPVDSRFEYNTGENGIEERKPDYLVISSYIYTRFDNEQICQQYPAECEFFVRLQSGDTNYKNVGTFKYFLPKIFPQLDLVFINPDILVYERID